MKVKVSIIVAAYNIDQYILRCMKSLVNQSYENLDIIVVNDGSTDKTREILNEVFLMDSRVKIINQLNKGLSEARKTGYKKAEGEYILFIDGDDWLEERAIEELVQFALKSDADIVLYDAYESWECHRNEMSLVKFNTNKQQDYLGEFLKGNILPNIWAKFVKANFLKDLSNPLSSNISYGEDLATVSVWFMADPKVTYLQKHLYNYYQRSTSITNTVNKKILEVNEATQYIKRQLVEFDLYEDYKEMYEYLVYYHLFDTKFLYLNRKNEFHKLIYNQFINYCINPKNSYVNELIGSYALSLKIRVKCYLISYTLGRIYDEIRSFFKEVSL